MLTLTLPRSSGARPAPSLIARFFKSREVARQRRQLAELNDELLEDIGLSRLEALREAERPTWDAPRAWMK